MGVSREEGGEAQVTSNNLKAKNSTCFQMSTRAGDAQTLRFPGKHTSGESARAWQPPLPVYLCISSLGTAEIY